jgi:hypothetical protein
MFSSWNSAPCFDGTTSVRVHQASANDIQSMAYSLRDVDLHVNRKQTLTTIRTADSLESSCPTVSRGSQSLSTMERCDAYCTDSI